MAGNRNIKPQPVHFSGDLLIRNTFYNLAGYALPLIVAVITVPILIRSLGIDRFGILTLTWMVVGYFGLFDLGIGRATTKFVSEYIGRGELKMIPPLVWSSIIMLLSFGIIGGAIIAILAPWIIQSGLKIPGDLIDESIKAFYVLAVCVPFVLGTGSVRGVLEARQKFGLVNAIKIPGSISNFVAPLTVLYFSRNVYHVVTVLVVCRIIIFLAYLYFSYNYLYSIGQSSYLRKNDLKILLRFGGWLTVTNIINPFMTYLDRFIIGATLSMGAVAYYTTPYDLVVRLGIISGSVMTVLFPVFSSYSTSQHDKIELLYERIANYLFIIYVPLILLIVIMARPFLDIWVGSEFANNSTLVLQIIAVGMFINAFAGLPYALIQALGRPDVTAKLHLFELPMYIGLIWYLIFKLGIVGVAIAWSLRVALDTVLLFYFAYRLSPNVYNLKLKRVLPVVFFTGVMMVSVIITNREPSILFKLLFFMVCTISFFAYSWTTLLDREKEKINIFLKNMRSSN